MSSAGYQVVPTYQIPLQHSIQDCQLVLEGISAQLHRLSDAAYMPMNALEYSEVYASVEAIHQVLKGADAATAAEVKRWGL